MLGFGGDDTFDGGKGRDDIRGGGDNDTLNGGAGADRLEGDADDDTLNGEAGADKLFGDLLGARAPTGSTAARRSTSSATAGPA